MRVQQVLDFDFSLMLIADGSSEAIMPIGAAGATVSVSGHTSASGIAGVANFTDLQLRARPGQYTVYLFSPYAVEALNDVAVDVQVGVILVEQGMHCNSLSCGSTPRYYTDKQFSIARSQVPSWPLCT